MAPFEELRPHAARLGRLLGDERGGEVLAELQKLRRHGSQAGSAGAERDTGPRVGIWLAEQEEAGIALRVPAGMPPARLADWADVPYVPPAGAARRVVLIGESAARGWPLDPVFNPAASLRQYLSAAAPGAYQCVDLAKTGATEDDLTALAAELPRARPDIVVAFAGNNWSLPPDGAGYAMALAGDDADSDRLARALRDGGYPAMRREFIAIVVIPRARRFCAGLAALRAAHGIPVIVVIPEFNLREWRPPGDAEVPVLPAAALRRWFALRARAELACAGRERGDAERLVTQMRQLDGGYQPGARAAPRPAGRGGGRRRGRAGRARGLTRQRLRALHAAHPAHRARGTAHPQRLRGRARIPLRRPAPGAGRGRHSRAARRGPVPRLLPSV